MSHFNKVINTVESVHDIPHDYRHDFDFVSWDLEPPCDIITLFSHTLSRPVQLFDEYRELLPDYGSLLLFDPGCAPGNEGCDQNEICNNATTLFGSWKTLWTCLTLAGLADASREFHQYFELNSHKEVIGDGIEYDPEWVSQALQTLGLNLTTIKEFDTLNVFNLTSECAQASCVQWKGEGHCSLDYPNGPWFRSINSRSIVGEVRLTQTMILALDPVCENLQTLNVDIAGPGVSKVVRPSAQAPSVLDSANRQFNRQRFSSPI